MLSRPHLSEGWLFQPPGEWRATLERCLQERDRLEDPTFSGHPPAFLAWVRDEQLPRMARQTHYRPQFLQRLEARRDELRRMEQTISEGHAYLQPEADAIAADVIYLEGLLSDG